MPDKKNALRELILQQIPREGGIGNKALLEWITQAADVAISEQDYRQARDGLIVERLIDDALASKDDAVMRQALEQLKRMRAPYLDWTDKAEGTAFEVDLVSLHVHERIDPATILAAIQKHIKSPSPSGLVLAHT
jgi:hypothetical protein